MKYSSTEESAQPNGCILVHVVPGKDNKLLHYPQAEQREIQGTATM